MESERSVQDYLKVLSHERQLSEHTVAAYRRDLTRYVSFLEELGSPPGPYERLLTDALHGDTTLFPRWDVIEETWRIVQPLLDAPPPVETYRRGTWGPRRVANLARRHGGWREPR